MRTRILLGALTLSLLGRSPGLHAGDMGFWDVQRKGANVFANVPAAGRFTDAAAAGIVIVRLSGNKWLNGRPESERGDFLLGPRHHYAGLVARDVTYLLTVLDDAHRAGLKVVLTTVSLPGSRWRQHNCVQGTCTPQYDLWRDFAYHRQAASFWRDLAQVVKDHPAIVGYNILNEPCPERGAPTKLRDWYTMDYQQWYRQVQGTPADLNLFYRTVIRAIREVDARTPVVLDSGFYANPYAFQILDPAVIDDAKVIYSFHSYEPAHYATGANRGRYRYPGDVPTGELDGAGDQGAQLPFAPVERWDRRKFGAYFAVVTDWMARHRVPANRVYVGEFGGFRDAPGMADFLRDSIAFFDAQGWHWSFYAYREDDGFPQMDYELGPGKLSPAYWDCSTSYACAKAGLYRRNPLWDVIREGLTPK